MRRTYHEWLNPFIFETMQAMIIKLGMLGTFTLDDLEEIASRVHEGVSVLFSDEAAVTEFAAWVAQRCPPVRGMKTGNAMGRVVHVVEATVVVAVIEYLDAHEFTVANREAMRVLFPQLSIDLLETAEAIIVDGQLNAEFADPEDCELN